MVDLSSISRNLPTDPLIGAGAAQSAGKAKDIKRIKGNIIRANKGLGLEDIPEESAYVNVDEIDNEEEIDEVTSAEDVDEAQEAQAVEDLGGETTLANIDYELAKLQALMRKVVSRKIQLADKHEDRKHELLVSAFNDCKNAYVKIREVRNSLDNIG